MAECRALGQGSLAAAMHLAVMLDQDETRGLRDEERAFFRVAANLTKMRSSQHSHRAIMCGIETLGGNGAVESFSILPRLIRDNIVYENWEGTHNTLSAQTARDLAGGGLSPAFFSYFKSLCADALDFLEGHMLAAVFTETFASLQRAVQAFAAEPNPGVVAYHLKPHAERLADLFFAVTWARDLASEADTDRKTAELAALSVFADIYVREVKRQPEAAPLALVAPLSC